MGTEQFFFFLVHAINNTLVNEDTLHTKYPAIDKWMDAWMDGWSDRQTDRNEGRQL